MEELTSKADPVVRSADRGLLTGCLSLAVAVSLAANAFADASAYHEVGGDNQDFTLTDVPTGVTAVKKIGTGTMTENGALESLALLAAQGKTVISPYSGRTGFRHYRFKVDRNREATAPAGVMISELRLYNGETDVTGLRSGVVFDGKEGAMGNGNAYPTGQTPNSAVDGDVTTYYFDRRLNRSQSWTAEDRDKVWMQISFENVQPVTSYDWARGDGNEGFNRDPADWRFQGSEDGLHWFDLDVRQNFKTTKAKANFVGPFACSSAVSGRALGPVAVRPGAEVEVCGTDLAADNLSGGGVITCKDGGELRQTRGVTEQRGVRIDGKLRVLGGTWRVCGDVIADPYYRFTFKKVYKSGNKFSLAEIAFFDREGERTGYGTYTIKTGIAASDLQPGEMLCQSGDVFGGSGSEGPDKMFDGNLASGKCLYSKRNTTVDAYLDPDDPNTWFVLTVRLPEGSNPVCGYNFLSCDDPNNRNRSPIVWVIETSADGVTWTKRDEVDSYKAIPPSENFTFWNEGVPWDFKDIPAPAQSLAAADVQVASNATLEVSGGDATISRLSVDLSVGGGTITTFAPAAQGSLYLTGTKLPPEGTVLTVGAVVSPENLSSWKVYFNGVLTSRGLECKVGKLCLTKAGLLLLFR